MSWSRKRGARVPEEARFFDKVAVSDDGCWAWTGALVSKGYGSFRLAGGGTVGAHRWSWEHHRGPIPVGMEIDHLCFNRACVNPAHLEPVSHGENVRRGRSNQNAGKTHCIHGHEFTEENTYASGGRRACRQCGRERMAALRRKRVA